MFLQYCQKQSYDDLLFDGEEKEIEEKIIDFIYSLNERNLSGSFFKICLASLKHFYNMNDIDKLRWKKISKFVGECKQAEEDDRPYTRQEIQKLMEFAGLKKNRNLSLFQ